MPTRRKSRNLFLEFRRALSVISAERAEYLRGNQVILHMRVSKPTNCMLIGNTSSTAQGGGGSFKNRKPTGETGCCESGMAERSH